MHYGLLPRANRGIFAINELPDLAGKIQVGLFNIMQEGDVQIKGYPIRLPLDVALVFSANQGLLAAKAGAVLVSPFVGRLDDISEDGMTVVRQLAEIFATYEIRSEVLAASIRTPLHATQAALAGAHVATVPFKVLQQMVHHPLTDKGIVQFRKDWESAQRAGPQPG